jgi:hypothetical protein
MRAVTTLEHSTRPLEAPSRTARRPIDVAWAALTVLVPVIVTLIGKMGAVDLAYHVRTGDMILRTGSIPRVDTFTFTVFGKPWLDQQWLAQVVFAWFYRYGGWATLAALQSVLVACTFFPVYLACRASGAEPRTASLLTLGGFVVASPALAMRPQLLALPLFALTLWVVAGRAAHPWRMWLVPVFTALCGNVHGSFALFPLIVGIAWLDDVRTRSPLRWRTFAVGSLSMVATLANPFGIHVWSYAYNLSTNPVIRKTISEWAPVTLAQASGWFMIVSGLLVAGYFARRTRPVPWIPLLTLALFFILAMSAQRAIVWWGLVTPVVMAGVLAKRAAADAVEADADDTMAGQREATPTPAAREPAAPAIVIIATMLLGIAILLPWWRGPGFPNYLNAAPPGLTAKVQQLPPGTRLLVDQPWGSWFEFAAPDIPVFVDSRIEIVPANVWHDYGEVGFAGADWREVLQRYDVQAIVANASSWKLIPDLEADPDWKVAYRDDDGVLFVRRQP